MENTEKVLFDDPAPQWYVAIGDGNIGPLSAAEIYEQVQQNQLTWAHYVWKPGQSGWKRICDIKTFQIAAPQPPAQKPSVKTAPKRGGVAIPPPPKSGDEKTWFLHYDDSQYGPFTVAEVERFLEIGKIHGGVHAWRDGMDGWSQVEEVAEFKTAAKNSKAAWASRKKKGGRSKSLSIDQRGSLRRPLVSRLFLSNDDTLSAAGCRDVSVGGMQVLTDKIPGKPGSRLKMNVSPSGGAIKPFVAEGVIVRILEDGLGFSFRFDRLPDAAKKAIETYIASAS